jgi:hypothetical protein
MLTRSSSAPIQTNTIMPTRETRSSSRSERSTTQTPVVSAHNFAHSPYITRAMRRLERSVEDSIPDAPIRAPIVKFAEVLRPCNNITYTVDIDFDEASREWNRNKRRAGHSYVYVCGYMCASGKPCKRSPSAGCEHCGVHNK